MTYVREQTSAELAAHMRSLKKMLGWFEPLADRLWQEVEILKAENERLHKLVSWQAGASNEVTISAGQLMKHMDDRDQLKAENEIFEEGMRSLAYSLSAGGYNATNLTATQLVEKVQWGVDHLAETSGRQIDEFRAQVAGLRTGYEAYERVNAELKAECARSTEREILQLAEIEALRNAFRPLLAHWDDLKAGESLSVDAARAAMSNGEQSKGGLQTDHKSAKSIDPEGSEGGLQ